MKYNDTHRYDQTGYSSPTIWPQPEDYLDKALWLEDNNKAQLREESRQDWLDEQAWEARIEYLEYMAELKAEREELE